MNCFHRVLLHMYDRCQQHFYNTCQPHMYCNCQQQLYGNYQLHMCMRLVLLLHMYGSMYAVMVATATVPVAVRVQWARTYHHHQITKLSHSINAIGPAPHRGRRKREHRSIVFATITHIPSLHKTRRNAPRYHPTNPLATPNIIRNKTQQLGRCIRQCQYIGTYLSVIRATHPWKHHSCKLDGTNVNELGYMPMMTCVDSCCRILEYLSLDCRGSAATRNMLT
jgi:hypothetical protein